MTVSAAERAAPVLGGAAALVTEVFDHAVLQTPDGSSTLTLSAPAEDIPGWSATASATDRAAALARLTGGEVTPLAWVPSRVAVGERELPVGIVVTTLPPSSTRGLTLVDGSWPAGPGQIAVQVGSPAADWPRTGLKLIGPDGLPGPALRVTGSYSAAPGVVASTEMLSSDWSIAEGAPTQFAISRDEPVTWDQVQDLGAHGLAVLSHAVLANPPPSSEVPAELRGAMGTATSDPTRGLPVIAALTALAAAVLSGLAHLVWRIKARGRSLPVRYAATVTAVAAAAGVAVGAAALWGALRFGGARIADLVPGPLELPLVALAVVGLAALVGGLFGALWPRVVAGRRWVIAMALLAVVAVSAGFSYLTARMEAASRTAATAYLPAGKVGEGLVTWDPEGLTASTVRDAVSNAAPERAVIETRIAPSGEFFTAGKDLTRDVVTVVPPGCTPAQTLTDASAVTTIQREAPCTKVGTTGTLASSSILVLPEADIVERFALSDEQAQTLRTGALVLVPGLTDSGKVTFASGRATRSGTTGEITVDGSLTTWTVPAVELAPSVERAVWSLRSGVVLSTAFAAEHRLATRPDALIVRPAAGERDPAAVDAKIVSALEGIAVGDGSVRVEFERGYARSDTLVRLGLLGGAVGAALVALLAAAAVRVAHRDLVAGRRVGRRWRSSAWTVVAGAVAILAGVVLGYAVSRLRGSGDLAVVMWAAYGGAVLVAAAVVTAALVRRFGADDPA